MAKALPCKRCGGTGCDWCVLPASLRPINHDAFYVCVKCGKRTKGGPQAPQPERCEGRPTTGMTRVEARECADCFGVYTTDAATAAYRRRRDNWGARNRP